jgi:hypothetical protein
VQKAGPALEQGKGSWYPLCKRLGRLALVWDITTRYNIPQPIYYIFFSLFKCIVKEPGDTVVIVTTLRDDTGVIVTTLRNDKSL